MAGSWSSAPRSCWRGARRTGSSRWPRATRRIRRRQPADRDERQALDIYASNVDGDLPLLCRVVAPRRRTNREAVLAGWNVSETELSVGARARRLNAAGLRFAIVVSRFNSIITERLLSGALDALARTGWFDTAQLARIGEAHIAGRADNSRLLWQLLMLDKSLVRLGVIGLVVAYELARRGREVLVLDRATGELVTMSNAECGFTYRDSAFKGHDRYVVCEVVFELRRGPLSRPVRYAEVARTMGVEAGERVPLARAREVVLGLRRGKGMVLDPADPDSRSAGSFFTNPVLSPEEYAAFRARAAERLGADTEIPGHPDEAGNVKLSAAWLIDRAGFAKGYRHGGAGISTRHALALVNYGGTTAELLALAENEVADLFRIELHQSTAGRIDGEKIVAHDDDAHRFRGAVERAVAFHGDDAIDDGEIRRARESDIDDAVVNAAPVQFVLRPAVADAGQDAKEVLERQGRAGPVVRL